MDCPYAEATEAKVNKRDPIIICKLISDAVGWNNGVLQQQCDSCERQIESPKITEQINVLLRNRIALHWNWDNDPRFAKDMRDDLEASLTLYRDRCGKEAASEALVQAVENGLPEAAAQALAKKVLPEQG